MLSRTEDKINIVLLQKLIDALRSTQNSLTDTSRLHLFVERHVNVGQTNKYAHISFQAPVLFSNTVYFDACPHEAAEMIGRALAMFNQDQNNIIQGTNIAIYSSISRHQALFMNYNDHIVLQMEVVYKNHIRVLKLIQ